jgi:hypothetical protein
MAKQKKNKDKAEVKKFTPIRSPRELINELGDQFNVDDSAIETIRATWDEKERIFFGQTGDDISSKETVSQVFDPRLSSIVIERCARVMAQVPTGKIQALSQNNKGKNTLMNMVFDKYVLPNANTQFDVLTKLRLLDMYSLVYGTMTALVDWTVKDSYVGPDFWLIPIRNFHPQSGVYQIEDMDRVFVDSEVTLDWLLNRQRGTWKNIDKIYETIGKDGSGRQKDNSADRQSWVEREFNTYNSKGKGRYANVLLRTRYEKDRWVTYAPDFDLVLRDLENPQKNGKLPVVAKHAFPLLDRFYGLGEFERGETLQKAINALINLYLDGVKMSIFPPTIVNPDGTVASSIDMKAGAVWLETMPNSIREHNLSPQGTNTFASTYQFLNAALLNQAGTTDTTVGKDADMTQGKTPQALKMLEGREASRDNWDRFMMEKSVEQIFDRMVNLVCKKQEKPIEVELFKEDIEKLGKTYPDVMEIYESGDFGKAMISKTEFQNMDFKYFIDAGTTLKKDEAVENAALTQLLTLIMKTPALAQQIPQGMIRVGNVMVDFGQLLKQTSITMGIPNIDKIVLDATEEQDPVLEKEQTFDAGQTIGSIQDPVIRQVASQLFQSGGAGGLPPQSMSQVPPMQGGLNEGY